MAVHTGDAEFEVSILVAEGRDNREIELRSNRPVARLEVTGDGDADRHLEDVLIVDFGLVTGFKAVGRRERV